MTSAQVRGRNAAGEHKAGKADIEEQLLWRFLLPCLVVVGVSIWLWHSRIEAYRELVDDARQAAANYADPNSAAPPVEPFGYLDAIKAVLWDENGFIALGLLVLSIGVMGYYWWWDFRRYLLIHCRQVEAHEISSKIEDRKRRILNILQEPPGDLFTLIGIAFTFAGLAAGMATISTDVIQAVSAGSDNVMEDLAAAAIVFGSSLAIGLIASLFGVVLAVQARICTAIFCPEVKLAWEIDAALGHGHGDTPPAQPDIALPLADLAATQKSISSVLAKLDLQMAAMTAEIAKLHAQLKKAPTKQRSGATDLDAGKIAPAVIAGLSTDTGILSKLSASVDGLTLQVARISPPEPPPPAPKA